ncbi:MAG: hypothetical protein WDN69_12085 [Aliidongia sp.]
MPEPVALELLDHELQMGDHRLRAVARGLGFKTRGMGCSERCAERLNIVGEESGAVVTTRIESRIRSKDSQKCWGGAYPARSGRNVWRGFRQSSPSTEGTQEYPLW